MTSRKPPVIRDNTPEEEATIRAAVASDPDTRLLTEEDFKRGWRGRGRPPGRTKERITIRLDKDIVAHFRSLGKGWQSRLNAALREHIEG